MAPSEFWGSCLEEIMLLLDAWTPERRFGNLSESQVDELVKSRAAWEAKGFKLI